MREADACRKAPKGSGKARASGSHKRDADARSGDADPDDSHRVLEQDGGVERVGACSRLRP